MSFLTNLFNKKKTEKERTQDVIFYLFECLTHDITQKEKRKVLKMLDEKLPIYVWRASAGETVLIYGIHTGDVDIVSKMLDQGAPVDEASVFGKTPLMYAADKGYLDIVKSLLNHGADLSLNDNYGVTALEMARTASNTEVVTYLKNYPDMLKHQEQEKEQAHQQKIKDTVDYIAGATTKPLPRRKFGGFKK